MPITSLGALPAQGMLSRLTTVTPEKLPAQNAKKRTQATQRNDRHAKNIATRSAEFNA